MIRTEAMTLGITINPLLERAGFRIGTVLAQKVADETLQGKVRKMDTFWKKYGLGTVTLIAESPITLKVQDCFECEDLPVTGHSACAFDIGVLSAVFLLETGEKPLVQEVECYSSGYDHCTFIITENKR
jgi:predicted hydrocarbon binding protein